MKKVLENLGPIIFIALTALVVAVTVNAEPSVPAPVATAVATAFAPAPDSVPAIGGNVLAWLQALLGHSAPAWITGILVFLLELAGRVLKTEKPFSVLYFLRDLFVLVAKALNSAATFLDGLLQNSSDPKNPPPQV